MAKWWTTDCRSAWSTAACSCTAATATCSSTRSRKAFVDARVQTIYGGTNEIMKEIMNAGTNTLTGTTIGQIGGGGTSAGWEISDIIILDHAATLTDRRRINQYAWSRYQHDPFCRTGLTSPATQGWSSFRLRRRLAASRALSRLERAVRPDDACLAQAGALAGMRSTSLPSGLAAGPLALTHARISSLRYSSSFTYSARA